MAKHVVLFPDPDSPTMEKISPLLMEKEMPLTALKKRYL